MPVPLQLSADEVARLRLLDSELSKVQLQFQRNSKLLQEMREAAIRAESQATMHAQVCVGVGVLGKHSPCLNRAGRWRISSCACALMAPITVALAACPSPCFPFPLQNYNKLQRTLD